MSLTALDKIDWCYTENERSRLLLLAIFDDDINWENEIKHLLALQEKINKYILYIETEQYKASFPDNIFSRFKIQIMFKTKPTKECIDFLIQCSLFFEDYNRTHKISIKILEDFSSVGQDLNICEKY